MILKARYDTSYGIYHIVTILFDFRTEACYVQPTNGYNYYNDTVINIIYKFKQTYIFLNVI